MTDQDMESIVNAGVREEKLAQLDGSTLADVIREFTVFAEANGIPVEAVVLEQGWSDNDDLCFVGVRPPTEKEKADRRTREEKRREKERLAREAVEARERALLAKLQKKYSTS